MTNPPPNLNALEPGLRDKVYREVGTVLGQLLSRQPGCADANVRVNSDTFEVSIAPGSAHTVGDVLVQLLPDIAITQQGNRISAPLEQVVNAMAISSDDTLRRMVQDVYEPRLLHDHAMRTGTDPDSRNARFFGNIATGRTQAGQFFDVTKLVEYFNPPPAGSMHRNRFQAFSTTSGEGAAADNATGEYGLLARRIVEGIQDYGYNRLTYAGKGSNCIAFSTPANQRGERQLIVIGTPDHYFIPHPAMLPPKAYTVVRGNDMQMMIRVMPCLNMQGVTDADVQYLADLCRKEKSGLDVLVGGQGSEIKKDNIGILEYDKPGGGHVRLPYLLDWGTFNNISSRRAAQLVRHWASDPDLEPYREAAQYLKKFTGPQDVLANPQEMRLFLDANNVDYRGDPQRMAVLISVFREAKLTPQELAHVATGLNAVLDRFPDYRPGAHVEHAIATAFATGLDTSLEQNPPQRPRVSMRAGREPTPHGFLGQLLERAYQVPAPVRR